MSRTNEDSLPPAASLASSSVSTGTTSHGATTTSSSFPPTTNYYTSIPPSSSSAAACHPHRYHDHDHYHVRSRDNDNMIRRGGIISSLGTNHTPSCKVAPTTLAPSTLAPAHQQPITSSSTAFRSIPTSYCLLTADVSESAPHPVNVVSSCQQDADYETSNTSLTSNTSFSNHYHNQQQEQKQKQKNKKKTRFPQEKAPSGENSRSTAFNKIELCRSFPNSFECKFGDSCSFAHSYDELQLQTFRERAEKGLIHMDFIETYRSRPCFDFVATGSW